jgi:hypothetical protein
MNDRPTAAELIEAVRRHLEAEVLPALTDARLRFQTLVAANVLAVAGRELAAEEAMLREEWAALGGSGSPPERLGDLRKAVLDANAALCDRIRAGDYDETERFRALEGVLRGVVVRKLEVANPRHLAAVGRGVGAGRG